MRSKMNVPSASNRLAGVSMAVNVSNLFDKQYVASCLGEYNTFYGSGRTVLATLKYQW
ncbi:hypothetical protein [Sporomusa sphaeroides]|uniref:hypothetical protein n=1 Tax=Sporomusa sphaeroides TaxID=47679 RepID=UPI002C7CA031|nr:hypothetical protein [Sporomusa sphaeroides]HML35658.1 TonB-dependent receptor [Sporomusa sphaeroides]